MSTVITVELLERFDKFLAERDFKISLLIVGGAVFKLTGKRDGNTADIDSISRIEEEAKSLIKEFAIIESIDERWINDRAGMAIYDYLMDGWAVDSVSVIFSGRYLTIYQPSIENLLLSKICALVDRRGAHQDLEDIRSLNVSEEMFDKCVKHFIRMERRNREDYKFSMKIISIAKSAYLRNQLRRRNVGLVNFAPPHINQYPLTMYSYQRL